MRALPAGTDGDYAPRGRDARSTGPTQRPPTRRTSRLRLRRPGRAQPQLSAYFVPPSPSIDRSYLFPKLRFGYRYQFRARGVDLAGNSVPVTSTDASTATAPFTHYRYQPVGPPVLAGVAPFTPGEATLYLVLLNDQVDTPGTNGRWLFQPHVSELMAEEHGMFDGFSLGQPPRAIRRSFRRCGDI